MKSVEIDRGKRLRDQPTTGHNRFHPGIPPLVTVDEGEEVVLATRDGVDGQLGPGTTEADMAKMEAGAIHPLTGPVFVKGARPGDVLEVEFLGDCRRAPGARRARSADAHAVLRRAGGDLRGANERRRRVTRAGRWLMTKATGRTWDGDYFGWAT